MTKKGVWPFICLFREEEEKILREVSHCLNKINDMTPIGKKKRCVWPIWWRWVTRQKKVCVCDLFGGDEWHDQKKGVCVTYLEERREKASMSNENFLCTFRVVSSFNWVTFKTPRKTNKTWNGIRWGTRQFFTLG